MPGYRPLTTDDKDYPLADPSVASMRAAYAVEVRAGHKDVASRKLAAAQMGIAEDGLSPELSRADYVVEMARVLFPTAKDRMKEGEDVSVPEVLRATVDFFAALS